MSKVLVCDPIHAEGIARLENAPGVEVAIKTGLDEAQLCAVVPGFDAVIIRSGVRITESIINCADELKIIGRAGAGVDNIDVSAATKRGVLVVNSPGGNTVAAAEHTIAMMMALARNIPQAFCSLKAFEWNRKPFVGAEVTGKTLGVVGLGKIGIAVAERAIGLKMRVLAYDPVAPARDARQIGVQVTTLDEVIRESEFITVHAPLTEKTRHMIGAAEFEKMKPGVRIINCARGGVVDESALLAALESGKAAGAALDVFENEPPGRCPIIENSSVICTPHLGASTQEAQSKVAVDIANQVLDYLAGRPVRGAVNMPSIAPEVLAHAEPYLNLAARIGKLHAALMQGQVRAVEALFRGEFSRQETDLVTRNFIVGLLKPSLSESVNWVNARSLAEDKGIKVSETLTQESETYVNMISMSVTENGEKHEISGALFGRTDPRIVSLHGYILDFPPEGQMLVVQHKDTPGVIGKVGTILGRNNINISGMHVGRKQVRGKAVMALGIDDPINDDIINEILGIEGLLRAKLVEFD